MTPNRSSRWIRSSSIAVLCVSAGVLLFARANSAQPTVRGDGCVKQISKSANQYLRNISKARQICFQLQMKGELPLMPALDCTDPTTWANGGYANGDQAIERARLDATSKIEKRCSTYGLHPRMLAFESCPAPCGTAFSSLNTFDDVSGCMQCLSDACKQQVDLEAYGSVTLMDQRSDLPALTCQVAIGRAVADYTYKRLKVQAKCQSHRDHLRAGWESVDCTDLEDVAHPQHEDFQKLVGKLHGAVSKGCQQPILLASILDSCASDVPGEVGCLQDAASACIRLLHVGTYPQTAPTPTGFIAPSPTPSTTPAPAGKPCLGDSDCFGSVCSVDGICCNSRCEGTCESCRELHTGNDDGICSPISEGEDPAAECNDDSICTSDSCDGSGSCQHLAANPGALCGDTGTSECSSPDTCDSNGVCRSNHILAGTQCGQPGNACVRQDTCDGAGHCLDNGFEAAGATCGSSETECSAQDRCDGNGACLPNDYPSGRGCGDLAGPCTYADSCDGNGTCGDGGVKSSGTLCGLSATECSAADTCDDSGVCQPNHLPLTVSCGPPANECTRAGHCDAAGSCTVEYLPSGTVCGAPGSACSDQDTCDGAGTCRPNHVTEGVTCGDAGTVCTNQDRCDGDGACVDHGYKAPGTSCGDAPTECSERDSCDGTGNCLHNDFNAGTPCGSALASDCTAPDTCNGAGACAPNNAPLGSNCGDAGNACTNQDTCDAAGTCIDHGFIVAGTQCGDTRDTVCTDPDTCNGAGACLRNDAGSGTACGDSANDCRLQDGCDGFGECADRGFRPLGTACGSQVDTSCDDPDSCDGAGTCRANYPSEGTLCGSPGTECKVQDTCSGGGACVDRGFLASGTSCGDPSNTVCTDPDTCNGGGVCLSNHAVSGVHCGDSGTQCRVQDTCDGGGACHDNGFVARDTACGSATDTQCDNPDSCDGSGTCRANFELSGTLCGDSGTACVNQDVCNGGGSCVDVGNSPVGSPCADDNNPCTDDICGAGGTCLHVPNQVPCDDNVFCNGTDTCFAGGCAVHTGNPCPGPDGDTNCSETCNESAKACTTPDPDGSPCDDHLFCNGVEACLGGVCVSENIDPCLFGGTYGGDDDNDCKESCDEFTNTCTAADPEDIPCNDRTVTDNKFCSGGDVGNPCLVGTDCLSGVCGDVCTGPDNGKLCTSNNDCMAPGNCSGRACQTSSYTINEFDGSIHVRRIQQDRCVAGECVPGAPPCKGDPGDEFGRGIRLSADCQDACRESTDSCDLQAQDNIDCRDDSYCNGSGDNCSAGACVRSTDPCQDDCVNGGDPSTCPNPFDRYARGDGDNDCSETCRATTPCTGWGCIGRGDCTNNDPAGTSCKDGDFCTRGDTCNASGQCVTSTSVNPCTNTCANGSADLGSCPNPIERFNIGDNDSDCSESCQDLNSQGWEAGNCDANDNSGTTCTDYTFCNGTETCNGAGGCPSGNSDPCASVLQDGDNNCNEACTEPGDNTCRGGSSNGQSCSSDANCPGGFCLFGNNNGSCTSPEANGSTCVNPIYCDGALDRCQLQGDGASSCVGTATGNQLPCNPLNVNNSDCSESCRESNDTCTENDPAGTSCRDSSFCNGAVDTCNGSDVCVASNVDPCIDDDNRPATGGKDNHFCNDWCRNTDSLGNGDCHGNDPNGTVCRDDGFSCNGSEACNNGECIGTNVCCPNGDFTFSVHSNDGGSVDPAEWPGGTVTETRPARTDVRGTGNQTCAVTFCRPNGNIDLVGFLGAPFNDFIVELGFTVNCTGRGFSVIGFRGWTSCFATGGEDGDGCDVADCPPAGIGFCEATRPSCSAALNGTARATFTARCSD